MVVGRVGARAHDVVVGVVVVLELDDAPLRGRLGELQEAAVAEALLAEVGLRLAQLVLQARQVRRRLRRELVDDRAQQRERGVPLVGLRRERDGRITGVRPLPELDDAALGEMAEQLDEAAEPVGRLAERRVLAQDRALQHRREHRTTGAALEARTASA